MCIYVGVCVLDLDVKCDSYKSKNKIQHANPIDRMPLLFPFSDEKNEAQINY